MELLILLALIGLLPAYIASTKGRSFGAWWLFGAALFIVALPMAIIAKPDEDKIAERTDTRKCPHCAELIKREAKVCRYCSRDVDPVAPVTPKFAGFATCPRCLVKIPEEERRHHNCLKV